jgi:hypothetical protein
MVRSPELVRVGLASVRWLLPWIAVPLVSATLVWAITLAMAGGWSARDAPTTVGVSRTTATAPAAGTPRDAGATSAALPGPCVDSAQPSSPWPSCPTGRAAHASSARPTLAIPSGLP